MSVWVCGCVEIFFSSSVHVQQLLELLHAPHVTSNKVTLQSSSCKGVCCVWHVCVLVRCTQVVLRLVGLQPV